jgi:hypothetical protein
MGFAAPGRYPILAVVARLPSRRIHACGHSKGQAQAVLGNWHLRTAILLRAVSQARPTQVYPQPPAATSQRSTKAPDRGKLKGAMWETCCPTPEIRRGSATGVKQSSSKSANCN